MWQLIVFTAFLSSIGTPAFGASAFKRALEVKKNNYIEKGTVIGGKAGQSFSLLKVRSQANRKLGIERVVLNLGDEQGRLLKGRLSFFQVNVEPEKSRVVINLSQVAETQVSEGELKNAFKNSPFVRSAKLIPDLNGGEMSLVLQLKREAKAEVFQMVEKGKPGRLVVDLVRK